MAISQSMYVVSNHRDYKGKTYWCHLLVHGYRDEDGKVKRKTLANLSHLPLPVIETIKAMLKGEPFFSEEALALHSTKLHGHVEAILEAMTRLGFPELLDDQPSMARDIIMAMIVARIIKPLSKLSTYQWWGTTSLTEEFELNDIDEDGLYSALDWLLDKKENIESKLINKHISNGSFIYYDLSSSYFEGHNCSLARFGHSRDKKRGKKQVNYGLVADHQGRPLRIELFPGNTSDVATFFPMVETLLAKYNLSKVVFVGDRGMISGKTILTIRNKMPDINWITALKSVSIRSLVEKEKVEPSKFDETNLFEIEAPDEYPGERLIFCRNPLLAVYRTKNRNDLLEATEKILAEIEKRVLSGSLKGKQQIGLAVGQSINKYKMKKHFIVDIDDNIFKYRRNVDKIKIEQSLDGIYVIRTSLSSDDCPAVDCVRHYKRLTQVERDFRSLKTVDLKVRPIFHYREDRVKSHFFFCLLANYVTWHLKNAWKELTYMDENPEYKGNSAPIMPLKPSNEVKDKINKRFNSIGLPIYSFRVLLDVMSTLTVCTYSIPGTDKTISIKTAPTAIQRRALELVKQI
ncbi:MAG: IS1634 family transposase [Deltaproteobacteria bacterium]|jgi:transposase|nr:IS1634 family transposase [Deltaproteobacteria bacterium]